MGTRRFCLAPILALFSIPVACYETKLIDDLPSEGDAGAVGSHAGEAAAAGGDKGSGEAGGETGGNGSGGKGGRGGGSSGGGSSGGGSSGGSGGGGGSAATGGASTGGESSDGGGGVVGGSGTSGTGGGEPLPGVTWLSFDNSAAPSTLAPNAELGVNGELYAYGDDCAELDWDPLTRCASGVLCQAGPNFQNWGIAVGFYFNTTGGSGTPPNTKIPWDPSEIGAEGIAWRISGAAPALQLWVLNMDPAYGGECADDACEILGPPDGTSTAALIGQLSFSRLHKDDWNGSGIVYTFDPAAVHALQFKLPAVVAGAASFSFCIDELGIILGTPPT
jgi:hypothetical protein